MSAVAPLAVVIAAIVGITAAPSLPLDVPAVVEAVPVPVVLYEQDVVLLKPAAQQLVKGLTPRPMLDPPAGRPLREWLGPDGLVCYTEACQDEVLGGSYRLNLVVLLEGKGEAAVGKTFWSSDEIRKVNEKPEKFLASWE